MLKKCVLLLFSLFFYSFCGSTQIKDQKSLEKNHEKALKGDKESFENYEKALEKPEGRELTSEEIELQKKVLNDLGTIPSENSTEILLNHSRDENAEIRSSALKSLIAQASISEDPEKVKGQTFEIIKQNLETYKELTPGELYALSQIGSKEADDILIGEFLRDSEASSDEARALGDRLAGLRKLPASEDNQAAMKRIEETMTDYLKKDHSLASKEDVLIQLYNAYAPDSDKKIHELYSSKDYPEEIRIMILKIISAMGSPLKQKILEALKKDYLVATSENKRNLILQRIGALDPLNLDSLKKELDEERKKLITQKEIKQFAGKNQILVLKNIFKKYKISPATVDQMNLRTIEAAADSTTPMKAESLIIFSALQELYPARNFFELKKISEKGLLLNGLFLGILNAIERDFSKYDMKIMTIQSVWKIDETSASRIYTLYRKEKRILELMR